MRGKRKANRDCHLAGDSVPLSQQNYTSYVEHLSSAKVKRRKNESFTTRLSEAPTPIKHNSISPQQQILVAAKSDLEREIAAVKKERDDLTASLSSQQSTKRLKTGPNAVCVSKSSSVHCKRTVTRLLKSSRKSWVWNLRAVSPATKNKTCFLKQHTQTTAANRIT
ncbi:uncharacterized protein LOC119437474 [Dermacentor silvarum]|uniref:uncharacterized protein LOC119437474 n=1 Tax=Dermacentor silvarum TaxID=543639 RepID=UPI0021011349|nr:uncharacterized protein LOC119437474 [Dermacentor silvarum]